MQRLIAAALAGVVLTTVLAAQTGFNPWRQPDGSNLQGVVLNCATGNGREAVPCGAPDNPMPTLAMPFQRIGDPILLPATTAPQQYQVTQPSGAKSYRGVNPCGVDVRIKTVAGMGETVTATTGTRFLARTAETLASSPPLTNPRIVSIMAVSDPGAGGCAFELGYGNGG